MKILVFRSIYTIFAQNMSEINEEKIWFSVGCSSPQKELKVRDDARQCGLEAFVPLRYEVRTIKHQKHRALVPAMAGLMFIKGTEDELKDYIRNHAHYPVYMKKSNFSNKEEYLTVTTKAMENFIAVTEQQEERITFFRPDEIKLQEGENIRIKGGLYNGREGIIMRIKGKRNKHLVVQIPGILIAAVELNPEMIEKPYSNKLSNHEKPCRSRDVDGDKKLLLNTAQRLLFEIPDKYQQENEYYLLLSELKRCRDRLKTFKGVTPALEAELALPMYLAAVKLGEDVPAAEERLRKAIDKLKDTSKLKALCIKMLEKTS